MVWKEQWVYKCNDSQCEKSKRNFRAVGNLSICNSCGSHLEIIRKESQKIQ